MQAVLIRDGATTPLANARLTSSAHYGEAWLQQLLFAHPGLLPLDVIDPGAGTMVPVCRELAMPKGGATIFLDILGFTTGGRPVLVECKLWRNPQARREVVGQLLEYAALLRTWSYADLTSRVKPRIDSGAENPVFDAVRRAKPDLDESRFVDAAANCLARGDFDLIVAGDGIRADMQAITAFLNEAGGLTARFALVEFQVWRDESAGTTVVLPVIPFQTEVVKQRVLVAADDKPLAIAATPDGGQGLVAGDPDREAKRVADRVFWDRFIESIRFSHPDQTPPRHGGWNWVRIALPEPCQLTLYRTGEEVGAFVTFLGVGGQIPFAQFEAERSTLEGEVGQPLAFDRRPGDARLQMGARKVMPTRDPSTADEQLAWLRGVSDRLVTAVRTRL